MRKMLNLLLVICMIVAMTIPVSATGSGEPAGYVVMSLDANTLGAGFLYEPVKVPFYEGENYAQVTDRFLGGSENYEGGNPSASGFYLAGVKLPHDITVNVPEIIMEQLDGLTDGPSAQGEFLRQFDYSSAAGWLYSVNNEPANVGASDKMPQDGDVCRWQFSLYGFGSDLGQDNSEWGQPALYEGANRGALCEKVAEINSAANKPELLAKAGVSVAYDQAYTVLGNLTVGQAEVDNALEALNAALNAQPPVSSVDISTQLNATLAYLVSSVPEPNFGGEWTVLTLGRAGYAVPADYFDNYYSRIAAMVEDNNGILPGSSSKTTEYSRLIFALSAIGKDATVAGYDLTAWLSSMSKVQAQGINGPIFALLALDTNNYAIPDISATAAVTGYTPDEGDQVRRQKLIDFILDKEIADGGWALYGTTPDPDITAMALQALAPYREQTEVAAAVSRAVAVLSDNQSDDGGYVSWGTNSPESIAQVIVALTALDIDPATDSRFVKEGNNPVTALLNFYVDGGGFKHVLTGNIDAMATNQAGYALVAYDRLVKGKNSLYDMTDAFESGTEDPPATVAAITIESPAEIVGKAGTAFNAIVKTSAFPEGNYKLLDGVINVPDVFSVEDVVVSDRLMGGALTWHYNEADHKLRFVYTNTELEDIGLSGTVLPAELFTIKLKVAVDIDVTQTPAAALSVGGVTLKEASDKEPLIFDISQSLATVSFVQPVEIAIAVRELFTGDNIDLIADNKRAVAVTISGIDNGVKVSYKDTELFYTDEMTDKHGVNTYVLMTTPAESSSDLLNKDHYTIDTAAALGVTFGDADGNELINAQDALDVISAWLRKTAVATDLQILQMNVTSDSRINTFDALSIMENYVSDSEFVIIGK